MFKQNHFSFGKISVVFVLLFFPSLANANLMITPTRVELNDRNRIQEVKLINKGQEISTYRISFHHLRMKEDGSYEEITENSPNSDNAAEKELFADDLVRFSPKRITLKPRETQTVRLMFRKTKDFKDGEYRSHLLFREEAPVDFGNNIEKSDKKDDKISIVLKPLFGISIPVIVQSGEMTGKISISDLQINSNKDDKNKKSLFVKFVREGNSSFYGDVKVFLTPKNGKRVQIGEVNGIAVFYPYKSRNLLVNVDLPKDVDLSDGIIDVNYLTKEESGKKIELLTKKSVTLN